ncbi:hypothetical protein EPD62_003490 [Acetivibrio thermocellus]|uniref:hypothetical protein n=1 Tax=Acetivibrio thermocellus TaxID=1515 RepID=UPI0034D96274
MKNNIVSTVVKAEKPINSTLRKFDLPYYALSREISYPLADSDIVFNLNNINGDWLDGSARIDKLNVNVNAGFLHNYQVGSSRIEDNENTITVSLPSVKAKVERKDFGDNPGEKKWLVSNNTVDVIKRILDTSYYLSVSKKYRYRIKCNIHEDCEAEGCSGYKNEIGNVSSSRSGNAPIEINTYVYNGKKDLKKKEYENKISNNYDKDFKAKILWTNNPIKFDVIRYMFHLDAADNPKTWEAVPGRYQREFVQQCSADIDWNVTSSIKQKYEQDREAARQGKRGQAFYNKVVFATDKNLISYDYPIKSGYYFNPAGKYTFEVTTVNYKTGQGKTKEHEELVNALINSFRYESNLIYINGSNQAVNIANGSYKTPGILTAKNNKGIGGKELISVKTTEYKNIANEIPYYSDKPYENENENKSHDFWKMSMEGYSLSGSLDSYTKYKYREYVAGNQKVYEITETTKVEIVVNGGNNKFYTHPKMPDGEYYIRVWLDNINLGKMSGVDYSSINDTLKGVILDNIKITVKGSIYDDIS